MALHGLLLSLSRAHDHVHPMVADHQQRVAYIAMAVAKTMHLAASERLRVMKAALLHDIGLVRAEHRVAALHFLENLQWHSQAGYQLLHGNRLLGDLAEIVLHHHVRWADARSARCGGEDAPLGSYIIALADSVERAIDRRTAVLDQQRRICIWVRQLRGKRFHPDCVDAFLEAGRAPAFWLDCACNRTYNVVMDQVPSPGGALTVGSLGAVAEMFSQVVDSASQWTAAHSAGVSAVAVTLARQMGFDRRGLAVMHLAGLLHDIGKISLPSEILDKAGGLSDPEWRMVKGHTYHTFRLLKTIDSVPQIGPWAAYHHERLDGNGYPFRLGGRELSLGSRIMAVADTFAALTENRPYRKRMNKSEIQAMLDRLAAGGGIDGDVVRVACREFDAIDAARRQQQRAQLARHRRLLAAICPARQEAVA